MSGVAPTPEQESAVKTAKELALAGVQGADQKVAAFEQARVEQQKIDDFMKANFDSYDMNSIRKYELEVRKINGNDITTPIIEQDLLDFVAKDSSKRLWNDGDYNPKRIAEFDGGPLVNLDNVNETYLFGKQDEYLNILTNGPTGQVILVLAQTSSVITLSSTTVTLTTSDPMGSFTINIGDLILIKSANDCCIVKALTGGSGGGHCVGGTPPGALTPTACSAAGGTWVINPPTISIEFIVPPAGSIASGTPAGETIFAGFNNSERTSHTASQVWAQTIMNWELTQLQSELNSRKSCVNLEKSYWQANENTSKNPGTGATLDAEVVRIDSLLGVNPITTINISNTGIATFNNYKVSRLADIATRLGQIPTEITTGDLYNKRYGFAQSRAQLVNGSLSLAKQLEAAKNGATNSKNIAQDLANRYGQFV